MLVGAWMKHVSGFWENQQKKKKIIETLLALTKRHFEQPKFTSFVACLLILVCLIFPMEPLIFLGCFEASTPHREALKHLFKCMGQLICIIWKNTCKKFIFKIYHFKSPHTQKKYQFVYCFQPTMMFWLRKTFNLFCEACNNCCAIYCTTLDMAANHY